MAVIVPLAIGGIGIATQQAMTNASHIQLIAAQSAANQADADMMHDALRADVLNALFAASRTNARAIQEAKNDVEKHIASFDEKIKANAELSLDAAIAQQLKDITPSLDAYSKAARRLVQIAQTDAVAAEALLPSFNLAFTDLETRMGDLSDKIAKVNEESNMPASSWLRNLH